MTVEVFAEDGIYDGWTGVSISRSLEQAAGTFSLTIEQNRARFLSKYPLKLETPCTVKVYGESVIYGVIEKLSPRLQGDSRTLTVSGRDCTRDMIDCSAEIPNQELKNVTVKSVAELLMKPYGITVDCPEAGAAFDKVAVNDGETAFTVIEQHARQRGFLVYTDGDKILHIRKASPVDTGFRIVEGLNLLGGDAEHDSSQLFGTYEVKSQAKGPKKNAVSSMAKGTGVAGRKLIIRAEKPESDTQKRAQWEAKTRQAKSHRANVTLRGWRYRTAGEWKVWKPNLLITLTSPSLMFDQSVLVAGVDLKLDDNGGELVTLALVDPNVYAEEPA